MMKKIISTKITLLLKLAQSCNFIRHAREENDNIETEQNLNGDQHRIIISSRLFVLLNESWIKKYFKRREQISTD